MDLKKPMEDLSNMVFGLALSIGALTLISTASSSPHVVTGDIATFAFSFLILIYIWFRYTNVLEIIKVETNFEVNLNIVLLFLVVIEPYLFNLLHSSASADLGFTSALFGLDIAGMMLSLGFLYGVAISRARRTDRRAVAQYLVIRNGLLLIGVIFAFSTLPAFWDVALLGYRLRFWAWVLSLVLFLLFRRRSRRMSAMT